jgi:hypothetical protein
MQTYRPNDELGRHLIQSIPHKIFEWLASAGLDADDIEDVGPIKWTSNLDGGALVFDGVTIEWTGHALQPGITRGSLPEFETLSENLKFFIDFEKKIYGEVEAFISAQPPK